MRTITITESEGYASVTVELDGVIVGEVTDYTIGEAIDYASRVLSS